jgi:predicted glutamine amidotransferase
MHAREKSQGKEKREHCSPFLYRENSDFIYPHHFCHQRIILN